MGVWGPVILDFIPYAPICAQFNSNLTQNRGIRRNLGDLQALFSPDEPLILCSGHIKHLQSKYLPNVCLSGGFGGPVFLDFLPFEPNSI